MARGVEERTGFRVLTAQEADSSEGHIADILHLGDVLEHLTEMENQLPRILRLIKPGGLLLAQGPLEGNFNFFAACCGLSRRLRPWHRTEMAPYHVLMATSRGQRLLFQRFGLSELEYSLHEVAWPAPSKLRLRDIARPKQATLFALRRAIRQLVSLEFKKVGQPLLLCRPCGDLSESWLACENATVLISISANPRIHLNPGLHLDHGSFKANVKQFSLAAEPFSGNALRLLRWARVSGIPRRPRAHRATSQTCSI